MVRHVHENDPDVEQAQDEAEAGLRESLGPGNQDLIDLFKFGLTMEAWQAEDEVGKYLVERCLDDLQVNVNGLLGLTDLSSQEAREFHAEARKCLAVLQYMEDAVQAGKEAEASIKSQDEVDSYV